MMEDAVGALVLLAIVGFYAYIISTTWQKGKQVELMNEMLDD